MIDFWASIIITFLISIATIITDWIAGKIIIYSKVISSLRRIVFSGLSPEDAISQAKDELERLKTSKATSLTWGSDLATVAVSMDFTALGIWIYRFPRVNPGSLHLQTCGLTCIRYVAWLAANSRMGSFIHG